MKRNTVIICVEPNRRATTVRLRVSHLFVIAIVCSFFLLYGILGSLNAYRLSQMTTVLDGSYEPLKSYQNEEDGEDDDEQEETPQESGVMIHVVPEGNKARWNHIEDLDSFFTRMYHYHQKHGFACMILQEFFELGQFIFVVTFSTFLFHCVDYSVLFKYVVSSFYSAYLIIESFYFFCRDKITNSTSHKTSIHDALLTASECRASMGVITWTCILIAIIFWMLRVVKVLYHLMQFWDIKCFFNIALKVEDCNLDNLTWHEIQKKVREVQKEQEMCIHKKELTELDIYHRILRFKNYMVAMINKSLLPVRLQVPIIGEVIFMTRGLKYNMELLLFCEIYIHIFNLNRTFYLFFLQGDHGRHLKTTGISRRIIKN